MDNSRSSIIIGILALILAIPSFFVALNELEVIHAYSPFFGNNTADTLTDCGSTAPAEITLSNNTAGRGETIDVFGICFRPGERVAIRVHVTEVGSATADSNGDFTQSIVIPSSAPLNFPTAISATGRQSIKTGSAPLTVTH